MDEKRRHFDECPDSDTESGMDSFNQYCCDWCRSHYEFLLYYEMGYRNDGGD